MAHQIEINVKSAANAEELADRFGMEPEQITEEAIAFAAEHADHFERWLAGQRFALAEK